MVPATFQALRHRIADVKMQLELDRNMAALAYRMNTSVSHYFKKLTQLEMAFGDSLYQLGVVNARTQDTVGVFA